MTNMKSEIKTRLEYASVRGSNFESMANSMVSFIKGRDEMWKARLEDSALKHRDVIDKMKKIIKSLRQHCEYCKSDVDEDCLHYENAHNLALTDVEEHITKLFNK